MAPHYAMVALTVGWSLIGVVLFGSPPAPCCRSCSAMRARSRQRFGAVCCDPGGRHWLVIYFTIASFIMRGTLL